MSCLDEVVRVRDACEFSDRLPESLMVAAPAQPEPSIPVASSTDAGPGTRAAACEDVRSIGNVEIRPRTIGLPGW